MSGTSSKQAYRELQEAALRLKRREVRLTQEPNGHGPKKKIMITGWVQTIFYVEDEGRVELRFTKDMLPYLSELTEQFTRYHLSAVAKMTSAHAIRLFEMLAQYGSVGRREVCLDQLREWFQLGDSYPVLKDLKRRVIDPAVEQINQHSPLQVTWSQRKAGRKVSHLVFDFAPKESAEPALEKKPKQSGLKVLTSYELSKLARPGESEAAALKRLGAVLA